MPSRCLHDLFVSLEVYFDRYRTIHIVHINQHAIMTNEWNMLEHPHIKSAVFILNFNHV